MKNFTLLFALLFFLIFPFIIIGNHYEIWVSVIVATFTYLSLYLTSNFFKRDKSNNPTPSPSRSLAIILILTSPSFYALGLLFQYKATGLTIIILGLLLFYFRTYRTKLKMLKEIEQHQNWPSITVTFPSSQPKTLHNGLETYASRKDFSPIQVRYYIFEFPIDYSIDNKDYHIEKFRCSWHMDGEDPTAELDYESTIKNKELNLLYNPKDHQDISVKKDIQYLKDAFAFFKKSHLKSSILFLILVLIGITLTIFL